MKGTTVSIFKKNRSVAGKTVLITGACGDIGGALARKFHAEGAHLVLWGYGDKTKLKQTAEDCGGAPFYIVDITNTDDVESFMRKALFVDCSRKLDILVCMAGIAGQSVAGGSNNIFRPTMRVNAEGTQNVVSAALALPFIERAKGTIVVTSSMAEFLDLPFMGAYGASKAAVGKWARALRLELKRSGVKVVTVCPNVIDTNMTTKGYTTGVGGIIRHLVPAIPLPKATEIIYKGIVRQKRRVFIPRWMVIVPPFAPLINLGIEAMMTPFMPFLRRKALADDGSVELTTIQR